MQKSPGSRALWRSGLFSLCAGALISLVLLRFLSQLDQPGLTPEDLRRSGAALALQILSISAAAIGFVTYTSLRTRSSLEQALTALTESCRIFRSAARASGAMVFCRKAPGRELISPQSREEIAASDSPALPADFLRWLEETPCEPGEITSELFPNPGGGPDLEVTVLAPEESPEERIGCVMAARVPAGSEQTV